MVLHVDSMISKLFMFFILFFLFYAKCFSFLFARRCRWESYKLKFLFQKFKTKLVNTITIIICQNCMQSISSCGTFANRFKCPICLFQSKSCAVHFWLCWWLLHFITQIQYSSFAHHWILKFQWNHHSNRERTTLEGIASCRHVQYRGK